MRLKKPNDCLIWRSKQMIDYVVPVGSYLSGRMDSGSLRFKCQKKVDRLYTFTAGFPNERFPAMKWVLTSGPMLKLP